VRLTLDIQEVCVFFFRLITLPLILISTVINMWSTLLREPWNKSQVQYHNVKNALLNLFFFFCLFICAYNVWAITPPALLNLDVSLKKDVFSCDDISRLSLLQASYQDLLGISNVQIH
jgi:hypothetical protein